MEPRIQYAKTEDGVSIAYWTMGQGPPVVFVTDPPWSNIEFEAKEWPWHRIVASRCTLVRYDHRGTGMSERDVNNFSLDACVLDLEAVVDRLALKEFILGGEGTSGPITISYADRHPARVTNLLLHAPVARVADFYELPRVRNAYEVLHKDDWEMFADNLGLAVSGWADAGLARDLSTFYRSCISPIQARAFHEAYRDVDVSGLLPRLGMPVSIVCPKESPISDVGVARSLSASIPQARLTIADSKAGWSPEVERAWLAVLDGMLAELTGAPAPTWRDAVPGALVTILFTDMESSTALAQRIGDAKTHDVRRAHNTIVRDALQASGGNEVKHTGDGIMASFGSASSALECGIAIQRGVEAHREEHPETPLGVYVGLNVGEPIAEEKDFFGTSVDLARRICDHAKPGQILVPDALRHLAAGKGFLFSDIGEVVPKGFEEPVRLYEVRWREED